MLRFKMLGVLLSAALTASGCPMPVTGTATVDFGASLQTIRGFGGSTAWITDLTAAQADSLFANGTNQQLGLSILRVRIDPAGSANWGTKLSNAQLAQARGANVIAAPWTPPASMKSNDNVVGGKLNAGSYGDYANYLESFVTYMAGGGVTLYGISMQNEPDAIVTYESCGWTGAQMDAWVANNSSVLTTRLIMPESESFNPAYSDPALADANAVGKISIIAGHLYGTTPSYYTNAVNKSKDVWMTEHYLQGTGISGALALAKEVHDSLTVGGYNAYLWWWIFNYTGGSYPYGLIDESNNLTLNGYAMGQYSKFVRPGYARSAATGNPSTNVYVSAYAGNGHFVIVALNLGSSSVDQPFLIQNGSVTSLVPYRTSSAASMAQLGPVTVSADSFTYTLPAQSITTFVQ